MAKQRFPEQSRTWVPALPLEMCAHGSCLALGQCPGCKELYLPRGKGVLWKLDPRNPPHPGFRADASNPSSTFRRRPAAQQGPQEQEVAWSQLSGAPHASSVTLLGMRSFSPVAPTWHIWGT